MSSNGFLFREAVGEPPLASRAPKTRLQTLLEERGAHLLGWRSRELLKREIQRELAAQARRAK